MFIYCCTCLTTDMLNEKKKSIHQTEHVCANISITYFRLSCVDCNCTTDMLYLLPSQMQKQWMIAFVQTKKCSEHSLFSSLTWWNLWTNAKARMRTGLNLPYKSVWQLHLHTVCTLIQTISTIAFVFIDLWLYYYQHHFNWHIHVAMSYSTLGVISRWSRCCYFILINGCI